MAGLGWVTLATNDSYAVGALVLGHSLKMTNTIADLIVLVTPGVTEIMREKLQLIYRLVAEVDVLDSKDESNLKVLKRPELGVTFTKLHCWRLTQYKKCVFLDADTLVLSNCDELFDREEFSAAPDVGWPDCFNSGVFVFQPSNQTYETLITFALEHGSFDGGDQGLLNLYFNRWARDDIGKHLPFVYNMCSVASYSYLPAFKQYGGNVKIVHFIGGTKPWLQTFNTETKLVQPAAGMKHLQDFLQTWWNIFCDNVHGSLTVDMSGLANAFAQFTLGAPRTESQLALEDHLRKQNWEVGNIDYLGRDSFDNIWTKIAATVASTSGTKETVAVPQSAPSVVSTADIISSAVKSNVESSQTSVALKDILRPQTEKPVDTVVALPKPIDLPKEVISDSTQNTAPPPLTLPTYAAVANSEPPPKPVVEPAVTATVSAPATSVSGSSPLVQQIKPEVVAAKPPPEEKKVVEVITVALTSQPEVKQVEPAVTPTPVEKIVSVLYKTEGIIEATQSTEGLLPITIAEISAAAAAPVSEEVPVIVSSAAVVKNVASAPAALPTQLQEIPAPVVDAPKATETPKVDVVKADPVKIDEVKAAPVKIEEVKAKLEEVPVKVEEVKVVVPEPAKVVEEQKPVKVEEKAKTPPVVVPVVEQVVVEKNGNNKKGKNGKQDKNGKAQEAKDKSAKLADKPQEKGVKAEPAKDDKSGKDEKAVKPDSPPCEKPQECAKQEKCAKPQECAKQDKCAKAQDCPKECAKPQDKSAKKQDCPKQQEKAAKQDKCSKQGKAKSPDRSKGKGAAKAADKPAEKVESDTKVPIVAEDAKLVKEQTAIAKSAEVIIVAAKQEESPKPEKKISPVLGKKSSKPDAPPKQGKQKTEPVPKKDNGKTAPQPKVDTTKAEPAKTEAPKTEAPKTEAAKTETAKTTTDKPEAAKPVDASKATEATIPAAPAAVQAAPTVEPASSDKSAQAAAKSGKKEATAAPTPPPRKSNNGGGGGKKGKSKK